MAASQTAAAHAAAAHATHAAAAHAAHATAAHAGVCADVSDTNGLQTLNEGIRVHTVGAVFKARPLDRLMEKHNAVILHGITDRNVGQLLHDFQHLEKGNMSQRRINRDLHFQPNIHGLFLLGWESAPWERVVGILTKPGLPPKRRLCQHTRVGVDQEVYSLIQLHNGSMQFVHQLAQGNPLRCTGDREAIKFKVVQQSMDPNSSRPGVNLIRIGVGWGNVGQWIWHAQIEMSRRRHPILGHILDGISRGYVTRGDLQFVFRLLHQHEVVARTAVCRVNLQRLTQLGFRLIVAGHFIEQLTVLHQRRGLQFLVSHTLDGVDGFLGGHPAAQLGQAGVDLGELFPCSDVVRRDHQNAVHLLASLGELAAGGVLIGQCHAHTG